MFYYKDQRTKKPSAHFKLPICFWPAQVLVERSTDRKRVLAEANFRSLSFQPWMRCFLFLSYHDTHFDRAPNKINSFCNHLKHVAFSTPKQRWTPPFTSCNVQVYNVRIPVRTSSHHGLWTCLFAFRKINHGLFWPACLLKVPVVTGSRDKTPFSFLFAK